MVDTFRAGGFDCFGRLAPDEGDGGVHGQGLSTNFTCNFQNTNGDVWRISISITWFHDGATGSWELGEISADAKQIKSRFQNQVE